MIPVPALSRRTSRMPSVLARDQAWRERSGGGEARAVAEAVERKAEPPGIK